MTPFRIVAIASIGLLAIAVAEAAEPPRTAGSEFRDCDDCPEMIVIPAGSFVMGTAAAASAPGIAAAEQDAVVIDLPSAFALGRQEVTRGQYARFVADSGHEPLPGCRVWDPALSRFSEDGRRSWRDPVTPPDPSDDMPAICISFADAQAYVRWLSAKTEGRYRLPSESEWEYAARGQPVAPALGRRSRAWLRSGKHL